jgi:hypothetical protein
VRSDHEEDGKRPWSREGSRRHGREQEELVSCDYIPPVPAEPDTREEWMDFADNDDYDASRDQ